MEVWIERLKNKGGKDLKRRKKKGGGVLYLPSVMVKKPTAMNRFWHCTVRHPCVTVWFSGTHCPFSSQPAAVYKAVPINFWDKCTVTCCLLYFLSYLIFFYFMLKFWITWILKNKNTSAGLKHLIVRHIGVCSSLQTAVPVSSRLQS